MTGAFIGWIVGTVLAIILLAIIPGDQGILAFFIGGVFGFIGLMVGDIIDKELR